MSEWSSKRVDFDPSIYASLYEETPVQRIDLMANGVRQRMDAHRATLRGRVSASLTKSLGDSTATPTTSTIPTALSAQTPIQETLGVAITPSSSAILVSPTIVLGDATQEKGAERTESTVDMGTGKQTTAIVTPLSTHSTRQLGRPPLMSSLSDSDENVDDNGDDDQQDMLFKSSSMVSSNQLELGGDVLANEARSIPGYSPSVPKMQDSEEKDDMDVEWNQEDGGVDLSSTKLMVSQLSAMAGLDGESHGMQDGSWQRRTGKSRGDDEDDDEDHDDGEGEDDGDGDLSNDEPLTRRSSGTDLGFISIGSSDPSETELANMDICDRVLVAMRAASPCGRPPWMRRYFEHEANLPSIASTESSSSSTSSSSSLASSSDSPFDKTRSGYAVTDSLIQRQRLPALLQLHEEILDFVAYISPTQAEIERRQALVDRLNTLLRSIWPNAVLKPFGSFVTGLYLPFADVDLVLSLPHTSNPYGDTPDYAMLAPAETRRMGPADFEREYRVDEDRRTQFFKWQTNNPKAPRSKPPESRIARQVFETLSSALQAEGMASSCEIIAGARVPIIKFADLETGLNIDICLNNESGLESAEFVRNMCQLMPQFQPLVMILKYFMHVRNLQDTYSGGLGSFALILLVIAALQHHPCRTLLQPAYASIVKEGYSLNHQSSSSSNGGAKYNDHNNNSNTSNTSSSTTTGTDGKYSGDLNDPDVGIDGVRLSERSTHSRTLVSDADTHSSLGVLLYHIFTLYGSKLNYEKLGLSVNDVGSLFLKSKRGWNNSFRPALLSLENPLDSQHDVGSNSFNIAKVRMAFRGAAQLIEAAVRKDRKYVGAIRLKNVLKDKPTLLQRLLPVCPELASSRPINWKKPFPRSVKADFSQQSAWNSIADNGTSLNRGTDSNSNSVYDANPTNESETVTSTTSNSSISTTTTDDNNSNQADTIECPTSSSPLPHFSTSFSSTLLADGFNGDAMEYSVKMSALERDERLYRQLEIKANEMEVLANLGSDSKEKVDNYTKNLRKKAKEQLGHIQSKLAALKVSILKARGVSIQDEKPATIPMNDKDDEDNTGGEGDQTATVLPDKNKSQLKNDEKQEKGKKSKQQKKDKLNGIDVIQEGELVLPKRKKSVPRTSDTSENSGHAGSTLKEKDNLIDLTQDDEQALSISSQQRKQRQQPQQQQLLSLGGGGGASFMSPHDQKDSDDEDDSRYSNRSSIKPSNQRSKPQTDDDIDIAKVEDVSLKDRDGLLGVRKRPVGMNNTNGEDEDDGDDTDTVISRYTMSSSRSSGSRAKDIHHSSSPNVPSVISLMTPALATSNSIEVVAVKGIPHHDADIANPSSDEPRSKRVKLSASSSSSSSSLSSSSMEVDDKDISKPKRKRQASSTISGANDVLSTNGTTPTMSKATRRAIQRAQAAVNLMQRR